MIARLCVLCVVMSGCAAPVWLTPAFDCAGPELGLDDVAVGVRAQASYRLRSDSLDVAFTTVLERRESEMVLIGFTPVGARAFHLQWTGAGSRSDSALGPMLAVAPETVARDLRRVLVAGPAEPDVTVTRDAEGAVRIRNERCDYVATVRGVGLDARAPN